MKTKILVGNPNNRDILPNFRRMLANVAGGNACGFSFRLDGSMWEPKESLDVDLVTVWSGNLATDKLTLNNVREALAPVESILEHRGIVLGVFDIGLGEVSIDVNVIVSQMDRRASLDFAGACRQVAIWDCRKNCIVPAYGNGRPNFKFSADMLKHIIPLVAMGNGAAARYARLAEYQAEEKYREQHYADRAAALKK